MAYSFRIEYNIQAGICVAGQVHSHDTTTFSTQPQILFVLRRSTEQIPRPVHLHVPHSTALLDPLYKSEPPSRFSALLGLHFLLCVYASCLLFVTAAFHLALIMSTSFLPYPAPRHNPHKVHLLILFGLVPLGILLQSVARYGSPKRSPPIRPHRKSLLCCLFTFAFCQPTKRRFW
jgi:hypothetical protein